MKLSPGVNFGFTRTKCSLAPKEILMLVVTGQSLLKSVHTPTAEDPELYEEHGDHDGHEGELDARVLAPLYSSTDRRFRKWEDVVWSTFACNCEDHLVTRRDASDITAVELGALHHELAVDPLRWFADLAMEKLWHSSVAKAGPHLVHRWYV